MFDVGQLKINTDVASRGASRGYPNHVCGGIFKGSHGVYMGNFSLVLTNPFITKLLAIILAIEICVDRCYRCLWLECELCLGLSSFFFSSAYSSGGRWMKCLKSYDILDFKVSHIYCEGNCCDVRLANIEIDNNKLGSMWFNDLHSNLSLDFFVLGINSQIVVLLSHVLCVSVVVCF